MSQHIYKEVSFSCENDAQEALKANDAEDLKRAVIGVALYCPTSEFAIDYCLRLVGHADAEVRGNAILGFGHLARRFGFLPSEVKALIKEGLSDPDEHVRGQALAAADDTRIFLKWDF